MPKPLIIGDGKWTADRAEDVAQQLRKHDASYIDGYSDAKAENEHRIREGQKPIPIPRLQWIRISRVDGADISIDEMHIWAQLGYQLVEADPQTQKSKDLEQHGWKLPPTAYVDAAGRVRRGDLALAIVDHEQAEANRRRQREHNRRFHAQPVDYDTGESTKRKVDFDDMRRLVED